MKLKEVVNTGNIRDLAIQYIKAVKQQDNAEVDEVKGLITSMLLGVGWEKHMTIQFLDQLDNTNNERDLMSLFAHYQVFDDPNINEESPADPVNTFSAIISIPIVDKKNVKADVASLQNMLKRKGIKILNAKAKPVGSFKIDAGGDAPGMEDNQAGSEVFDIEVHIKFQTRMQRDDLYDVIEPAYELTILSEKG
ncbi:MAG: hypothetical protein QF864_09685 [SAR202 cluster bacterium]|nr:hypothetical protein [SAR202 cluster bacterium]